MTLIQKIYYFILITTLVTGMVRYKKLTIPFKFLTISVLVTLLFDIAARFYAIKYKNNALIFHFMSICGYVFYALTYLSLFKSITIKKAIKISIPTILSLFFI